MFTERQAQELLEELNVRTQTSWEVFTERQEWVHYTIATFTRTSDQFGFRVRGNDTSKTWSIDIPHFGDDPGTFKDYTGGNVTRFVSRILALITPLEDEWMRYYNQRKKLS
jgi:hypothetical protein